ncbi:MAG TPA: histidinol dehydrogenase, partial [Solirubrobacterales bacterium]
MTEEDIRNSGVLAGVWPYKDAQLRELTARFDATGRAPDSLTLRLQPEALEAALDGLESQLRKALELAIANVRAVSVAQITSEPTAVPLPQGQVVLIRDVPVGAAGIYAPGGRAAYPSSVLMGVVPA